MGLKQRLQEKALELGFEDAGFTDAEPFALYIQEIQSRPDEMYRWVMREDLNILRGASVREKYPWARSILVLIQNYHQRSFPPQLVGKIGRCYQVDERKERGEGHQRLMDYFAFLKSEEVRYEADGEIPARMAAARAGVTTYGKNCFAYARRSMRGASWLMSIPLILDAETEDFSPEMLLNMTQEHYENKVWPLTFYISRKEVAKWQMNAARVLGNLGDPSYLPTLIHNLSESPHEIVRGMCAWALGRLGGSQARRALESRLSKEEGLVQEEIQHTLE